MLRHFVGENRVAIEAACKEKAIKVSKHFKCPRDSSMPDDSSTVRESYAATTPVVILEKFLTIVDVLTQVTLTEPAGLDAAVFFRSGVRSCVRR